jgi:hypothetical protein
MTDSKERRKVKRRPVLESFSLFVSVPKKGGYKLKVHDISEHGIGFDIDIEGEPQTEEIARGEKLDVHFYLNQTLYIPVSVQVARVVTGASGSEGVRLVGAEYTDQTSASYKALQAFVQMLDSLVDAAQIVKE